MQRQELKERLDRCTQAVQHHKVLLEKRELLWSHRASPSQKQALKEVDAALDLLDEEHEEIGERLKAELIDQIKQELPHAAEEHRAHERRLQEVRTHHHHLVRQHKLLSPLLESMRTGAQIPLKGRFFSFLLGQHPQALLARAIHRSSQLAEKCLHQIESPPLCSFLHTFLAEAHKPWNMPLYKGGFALLASEFSSLMANLEREIKAAEQAILTTERDLETWLNTYTAS